MGSWNASRTTTHIAGEDLSEAQHRFVRMTGQHTVSLAQNGSNPIVGVTHPHGEAEAGQEIPIIEEGSALVELGATVNSGQMVTAGADGVAVVYVPASGSTYGGFAKEGGVVGDLVEVELVRGVA